ncbi:MAG: biotin transporter BioY [Lachnospiraceae bacterium]|nr:biotin transporter BioY [Ruminococcus sp.]MCM1274889.1 biotin transporter BioY [Lachnospiraceae bacterium]
MNTEKRDRLFSVRSMVFMAIFAALICVAAPFSVPLPGLVPISLGTFAIYLTGAMLGGKRGAVAVCVYIMLGAVGLPVFTGFAGGLAKLFGPTGGYIVGYIPLVLLTGIFSEMPSKRHWTMPAGMALGTIVMYAFGTAWFMIMNGSPLQTALMSCVAPFLIGDAVKIALSTVIAAPLRARLNAVISSGRGK